MEIVYLNGKYLPATEALISPNDRGFLFADGVYEVMRWYGNSFLAGHLHLKRLKRSLHEIRLFSPEADNLLFICRELIRKNNLEGKQALVYFQITRGTAPRTHQFPLPPVAPTCYAFARAIAPDQTISVSGVNVGLVNDIRWSRCDIKSIALLPNILACQEAIEKGYYENLFVRNGIITEATHSNIFFVRGGRVLTHPESVYILSGITRTLTLNLCKLLGISVEERALSSDELPYIEEAFLTSTSAEILPVTHLEGVPVGSGEPGPVARRLQSAFKEMLEKEVQPK